MTRSLITGLSAGRDSSAAINEDGRLWFWGSDRRFYEDDNTDFELQGDYRVPKLIEAIDHAYKVYISDRYTIVLKDNGSVWTWLAGGSPIIADPRLDDFVRIPIPFKILELGVSREEFVLLVDDGSVLQCQPRRFYVSAGGQLETPFSQVPFPFPVASLNRKSSFTLAIVEPDRKVMSWGSNECGQIGDGTLDSKSAPVQTIGLKQVSAVAAGYFHSLAVTEYGELWSWGDNSWGQLGIDGLMNSPVPKQINLADICAISAGWGHSLAVRKDGTIWAWGGNSCGQLGNGTTIDSRVPIRVENLEEIVAVVADVDYSLALKADGTVWGWGANHKGQLGDGTMDDRTQPIQVIGLG